MGHSWTIPSFFLRFFFFLTISSWRLDFKMLRTMEGDLETKKTGEISVLVLYWRVIEAGRR